METLFWQIVCCVLIIGCLRVNLYGFVTLGVVTYYMLTMTAVDSFVATPPPSSAPDVPPVNSAPAVAAQRATVQPASGATANRQPSKGARVTFAPDLTRLQQTLFAEMRSP